MNIHIKKRLYVLLVSVVTFLIVGKFIYDSLVKSSIYFFSPTELRNITEIPNGKIRIGGMVKKGTLKKISNKYTFVITDYENEITVNYMGIKPNLFVEGQGAVVEGKLETRINLIASKILAKHDENYMPKEVADALKSTGDWKKKYGK
ncbi:MAG: cytochrome c maturation protein CcmE [Candidatus Pelagibacter sp.]|nr:cytochrome c maturation protein CcmE [Candidatus Pelagibacter sp.]